MYLNRNSGRAELVNLHGGAEVGSENTVDVPTIFDYETPIR